MSSLDHCVFEFDRISKKIQTFFRTKNKQNMYFCKRKKTLRRPLFPDRIRFFDKKNFFKEKNTRKNEYMLFSVRKIFQTKYSNFFLLLTKTT